MTRRTRWFCPPVLLYVLLVHFTSGAALANWAAGHRIGQAVSREKILEAEQRLSTLGYWTGPIDGVFDSASRHALVAFQKVEGRKRTGKLTTSELEALRTAVAPLPQHTGYFHVEIDLHRQVLFVVDESNAVTHILPVSTGNDKFYMDHGQVHRAHTPRGQFKVLRKIHGTRISSLGLLYYPNYIHRGIAIHGSWAVKVYPDSHGCIRIPMFAAKRFSELVPLQTKVIVY